MPSATLPIRLVGSESGAMPRAEQAEEEQHGNHVRDHGDHGERERAQAGENQQEDRACREAAPASGRSRCRRRCSRQDGVARDADLSEQDVDVGDAALEGRGRRAHRLGAHRSVRTTRFARMWSVVSGAAHRPRARARAALRCRLVCPGCVPARDLPPRRRRSARAEVDNRGRIVTPDCSTRSRHFRARKASGSRMPTG